MLNYSQSADKNSLAYLIGVYLGDGCISKSSENGMNFRLNTIDHDFAESTANALYNIVNRKPKIHTYTVPNSKTPNNSIALGCYDLCEYILVETDKKQRIPKWIMKASKKIKRSFIAGLMDSEGYVATRNWTKSQWSGLQYTMGYKSCDVWVDDFKSILQSVGVIITNDRLEEPLKEGYKTPRRLTISLPSYIKSKCYFNIKRKQKRLEVWKEAKEKGISLRDYTLGSLTG